MTWPPASASLARAVTPTTVPLAAFSATVLVSPLVSVGPTTGLSFTLLTAMLNVALLVEPSALVASTVMEWLVAVS